MRALLIAYLLIPLPTLAMPTTSLIINGIEAPFHPELLSILNSFSKVSTHEASAFDGKFCQSMPKVSLESTSCSTELLPRLEVLCLKVLDPLAWLARSQVLVPNFSNTSEVDGLLDVAGRAMARIGVVPSLRTRSAKNLVERIFLKVGFSRYQNELDLLSEEVKHTNTKKHCESIQSFSQKTLTRIRNRLNDIKKQSHQAYHAHLPYPLLTPFERKMLTVGLGALTWRMRGGGIFRMPDSWIPQHGRLLFVRNAWNALGRLNGGDQMQGLGTQLFKPLLLKGYSQFFDLGHLPGHKGDYGSAQEDFAGMKGRGEFFVSFAAQFLQTRGINSARLQFAGQQIASCYLYAWDVLVPAKAKWGEVNLPPPLDNEAMAQGPLTWGELCYGAGLGFALAETFTESARFR